MENTNFERDIRRGEIYWIEQKKWNTTEGSVQKTNRPGIIVSNDTGNRHAPVVQVVMTTTSPKNDLPTHAITRGTNQPSTVLCEQIHTISKDQIGRYISACTEKEMEMIEQCMLISLGIDQAAAKMPEPAPVAKAPNKAYLDELKAENEALKGELRMAETELEKRTDQLHQAVAHAKAREELLKEMYNDLLKQSIK